jgi:hypothetical protein
MYIIKLKILSHERHTKHPRTNSRSLIISTDSMEHNPPYYILLIDHAVPRVYGPEMLITVLTEPVTVPNPEPDKSI